MRKKYISSLLIVTSMTFFACMDKDAPTSGNSNLGSGINNSDQSKNNYHPMPWTKK